MGALDGQLALVTGGARGIGAAIAERLIAEGARVALFDRDRDGLEETATRLGAEHGTRPDVAVVDVRDATSVRDQVRAVSDRHDGVQVVVNNAGMWTTGPFADSDPASWHDDIGVNLLGVLNVTHAVLPAMTAAGYGRVINVVSDSGRVGEPNVTVYSAAKAGVMGFCRSLAKEVGRHGVTVNCVSLSTTLTQAAYDTFTDVQLEKMTRRYPAGRLGKPEDAAQAVAYFASPGAEWVTGQVLSVNGGYAML